MADKYFDPQLLTGANDGSSVANAWKTKEAMLAGSHSVGDRILMLRDDLSATTFSPGTALNGRVLEAAYSDGTPVTNWETEAVIRYFDGTGSAAATNGINCVAVGTSANRTIFRGIGAKNWTQDGWSFNTTASVLFMYQCSGSNNGRHGLFNSVNIGATPVRCKFNNNVSSGNNSTGTIGMSGRRCSYNANANGITATSGAVGLSFTSCTFLNNTSIGISNAGTSGTVVYACIVDGNPTGISFPANATGGVNIQFTLVTNSSIRGITGGTTTASIITFENNAYYGNTANRQTWGGIGSSTIIVNEITLASDPYRNRAGGDYRYASTYPYRAFKQSIGIIESGATYDYSSIGIQGLDMEPLTIVPTGLTLADTGYGKTLSLTISNMASYANTDFFEVALNDGTTMVARFSKARYVAQGNIAYTTPVLTDGVSTQLKIRASSDNVNFTDWSALATAATPTLSPTTPSYVTLENARNKFKTGSSVADLLTGKTVILANIDNNGTLIIGSAPGSFTITNKQVGSSFIDIQVSPSADATSYTAYLDGSSVATPLVDGLFHITGITPGTHSVYVKAINGTGSTNSNSISFETISQDGSETIREAGSHSISTIVPLLGTAQFIPSHTGTKIFDPTVFDKAITFDEFSYYARDMMQNNGYNVVPL